MASVHRFGGISRNIFIGEENGTCPCSKNCFPTSAKSDRKLHIFLW